MRTVVKIPRILQINRINGLTISVIFNNGQSRIIDFKDLLPALDIPAQIVQSLSNPKEFSKVRLANHTLSWTNVGETISFNGKQKRVPFEIGADVLFKNSQPEDAVLLMGIGKKIRKIREKAGLSQDELAQLSGTSRTYISRIENELSGIEISTLQKIVETGLGKQLRITIR